MKLMTFDIVEFLYGISNFMTLDDTFVRLSNSKNLAMHIFQNGNQGQYQCFPGKSNTVAI